MKFITPFKTLVPGDRYERDFFPGEVCPSSIEEVARAAGALANSAPVEAAAPRKPATKAARRRKA